MAALFTGATPVLAFVASMLAGKAIYAWVFGDPTISRASSGGVAGEGSGSKA